MKLLAGPLWLMMSLAAYRTCFAAMCEVYGPL